MSENLRFSDVFRGYRNVTLEEYGLISFQLNTTQRHQNLYLQLIQLLPQDMRLPEIEENKVCSK